MGGLFSKGFDPTKDISDLSGKVIIVTGGNAAARSEEKAKAAIERLKKEGLAPENGEVIWLELDLSDPKKAKKSAEHFLNKEKRLDVLINNAAMLLTPYAKSLYDIQDVMVVNHLSPFVFTITLLPLLKETAKLPGTDVRIVNVSSDAIKMLKSVHFANKEDFNDEHAKALIPAMARYGRSKLANVLFTKELQRRLDEEGVPIIVLSLHPGGVDTDGNQAFIKRSSALLRPLFKAVTALFFVAPSKGATSSAFAAAAPVVRAEPEKYKGVYLTEKATINSGTPDANNTELAKELWETTESLLKEIDV
ncbi:unnamed protein product [Somion occarium]|uniref:Uncharacterized protein n=1 Tax=Somion occarium TaxID=3059160 RepID=A0ABP1DQU8_9APHY